MSEAKRVRGAYGYDNDQFSDAVTISNRFLQFIEGASDKLTGSNFNRDAIEKTKPEEFENEPYYLMLDESTGYRNNHNLSLNMRRNVRPTLSALVDCCREERDDPKILFKQGMWVEYLAKNMEWKVGLVNRVIKQAPDSWDFKIQGEVGEEDKEIFYNVASEGLLSRKNVRAPVKGLIFLFGSRPWVWQQFILLKLERRLRFDVDHEFDFEEFDCVEFASNDFRLWLNAEENADFKKHYDQQPDISKYLLKDTLLKPFRILDDVVENEDRWNFSDGDISVYTYLSVLGSGFPIAIVAFLIQILAPLVILYNVMFLAGDQQNTRFETVLDGDDIVAANGNFLPDTDFDTWCLDNQNIREEGKIIIVVVLLVYMSTVLPETFVNFYRIAGGADTTFSRITSLREIIWSQDDDNVWQMIGFKLDRLMNTGYVAMLYTVMLFVLIQTPVILDIILNALAIDFIHEIDQNIAKSTWFDYKKRYIRAGTMELVIQSTLRLNKMHRPKEFCRYFGIDYEDYKNAFNGKALSLHDAVQARLDDQDPLYMTRKERVYAIVARKAHEGRFRFIESEYRKKIEEFGMVDKILLSLQFKKNGIFRRYADFRVWSRWEKILFLPGVPNPSDEQSSRILEEQLAIQVKVGKTANMEFVYHVMLTILGVEMTSAVAQSIYRGNGHQVPLKIIFGLFEIIFYVFQLLFPLIVLIGLFFVPYCY